MLAQHSGAVFLSLPEALLKALLETDTEVSLLAGVRRGSFAAVFARAAMDAEAKLIAAHGITVLQAPDAARVVTLAHQAAMSGGRAVAMIDAEGIDRAHAALRRASAARLPERGALCLVFEDAVNDGNQGPGLLRAPRIEPAALPMLEPSCVGEVREALDIALRLSRAASAPARVIIHQSILRTAEMVHVRPNRVTDSVDAMLARRRRRVPRWTADAGGVLRLARRLEVNVSANLPSPGERVPVGFITIGPARQTLAHVVGALDLFGRVPSLHLSLIHPIDDSAVERLLGRCEDVVVLEPRPGELEPQILSIAEQMRHRGEDPAGIWGLRLPQVNLTPARPIDAIEQSAPVADLQASAGLEPGDAVHPSWLVRKIAHLLQRIRPAVSVAAQLSADPPVIAQQGRRGQEFGVAAAMRDLRAMFADLDQWLRDRAPLEEQGIAPSTLALDGIRPETQVERVVHVELWDRQRFLDEGVGAIRQAARSDSPMIFLIADIGTTDGEDLERLARGVIPAECSDRVRIETTDLTDQPAVRDLVRNAAMSDRMTIILAHDGSPPQYDVAAIERALAEIDRLGFQPRQKLLLPADEACDIRASGDEELPPGPTELGTFPLASSWQSERISRRLNSPVRVRVRPLLQQVEVIRTRPPIANWRTGSAERPPVPTPLHGSQSRWRAHLAGVRAEPPGLAAQALCNAGMRMGYHVSCWHDPSPSGIGRRAWAQVLFTRPRSDDEAATLTAALPFGEADLLLGLDSIELLRAISGDEELQVASAEKTCVVADLARTAPPGADESTMFVDREALGLIASVSREAPRYINDVSEACRTWFHTDRVTDIALLGIAFQFGLVPATLDAMRSALASLEAEGFGRCNEAFEFGRRLAVDSKLMTRPHDDRDDDLRRLARRAGRTMRQERGMNRSAAARFDRMLRQSLDRMPGLMETDAGRQACRDFIRSMYRCVAWGGTDYAQRYADLICNLYDVDRGDTGRCLTRDAVLPLADAMLIRDPIYVATLAGSAEHRRRIRQWLNVRHARGDVVERRFLTRIDIVALGRRVRVDARSSDWLARAVASLGRVVPRSWRGTRHERELREYVIDLARQATQTSSHTYNAWTDIFRRLHAHAAENRLRGMAIAELRMLVESAMPMPVATLPQPVQPV
jgi:hypothetical protein